MNSEDRDFLKTVVNNAEFQRVLSLVLTEHRDKSVEYMRTCLNQSPPRYEQAIRAEAQASLLEGFIEEVLLPATK